MKSLSAFNNTKIDNPYIEPVELIKIEFSGLTLYLCDRVWGSDNVFDGQLYEPLILKFGSINHGKLNSKTYEIDPSETTFVIDNSQPVGGADNFSSLFSTYDPHYAIVTRSRIFNGASASGDKIDIFKGHIEDVLNMFADQITIMCSGYELDITNKFSYDIIDTATYPKADPDSIGKVLPQVWGTAKKIQFQALDAGGSSTIVEDITATITTIKLTDSTYFTNTGTIKIDTEEVTYTGNASNELTGCVRGANSTTAVVHSEGATVWQVQSEYIYGIGHAINSIDTVYAANVRYSAGFTAYTGQSGDEHASYPGKAIIAFDDMPAFKKEVSLTLDDSEGLISREATNLPIGQATDCRHDGGLLNYDDSTIINFPATPSGSLSNIYVEYNFELRQFGTPNDNMSFFLDGALIASYNEGDSPQFVQFVSSPLTVKKASWPSTTTKTKTWRSADGTGVAFTILNARTTCESTINEENQWGRITSLEATNLPVGKITSESACDESPTITFPSAPDGNLTDITITVTWDRAIWGDIKLPSRCHRLEIDSKTVMWETEGGTLYKQLRPDTIEIKKSSWQTSITKTPSFISSFRKGEGFIIRSAVQSCYTDQFDSYLSGNSVADVLIGGVSADIQGYQDDASGTYTGTPGSLIERPDHILKHILINRCGLTSSQYDATTYNAAGAYYTTNSFTLAPVILQRPNVRSLMNRIAHQAKSIEFWEAGVHHLVHIPNSKVVVKTLDEDKIDLNQIWVKYTPRIDILNVISARYARDWSGAEDLDEMERAVVTTSGTNSITKYGILEGEQLSMPYIVNEAQAQTVLDWTLEDWEAPRLIVELVGGYYFTDIELGDIIGFSFDADSKLDKALLGLVSTNDKFYVLDKINRADGAAQVELIKIV